MIQNLPTGPVTGLEAVRLKRRPARRSGVGWHRVPAVLGLLAAGTGVLLASTAEQVDVSVGAAEYEVAGHRLAATAPGVYEGSGAAVVIVRDAGATRAAASTDLNGVHMTGRCVLAEGAASESCVFNLGGRQLAAVDTQTRGGWHRRYADGRTVEIRTNGTRPVPVPFALGR